MFRALIAAAAVATALFAGGCDAHAPAPAADAIPTITVGSAHGQLPASDAIPVEGAPTTNTPAAAPTITPKAAKAAKAAPAKTAKAPAAKAAPKPAPEATSFPAPGTAHAGQYVRTPQGVAEWIDGQWVFCPNGWTDMQCGA